MRFSSRIRVRIIFRVWLVSCCAHVFVLLWVVIVILTTGIYLCRMCFCDGHVVTGIGRICWPTWPNIIRDDEVSL